MKIQLIAGWRTWWRWWSTHLKALGILIIAAPEHFIFTWSIIPHDIKAALPDHITTYIGIALIVASFFAQLVRQKKPYDAANRDREVRASHQ